MPEPIGAAALDTLLRDARSQNAWQDTPLPDGTIEAVWDLMKWGPTSANCEPARIVWCTSSEAKQRLADCTSEKNRPKILAAPATAIIGYDTAFYDKLPELFPHADARPWFTGSPAFAEATAFRNSSLQGAYLMIAVRALGLDAGPMSGFDHALVDAAFFADTKIKSNFICSIGTGDPSAVFGRLPRLSFADANTIL